MKTFSKSTILGLMFGVLLAAYAAFAFDPPASAPPGGNVPAPLNVGADPQVKAGGLWVGSLGVDGGAQFGGIVESISGGFRFPDGSTQTTAVDPTRLGVADQIGTILAQDNTTVSQDEDDPCFGNLMKSITVSIAARLVVVDYVSFNLRGSSFVGSDVYVRIKGPGLSGCSRETSGDNEIIDTCSINITLQPGESAAYELRLCADESFLTNTRAKNDTFKIIGDKYQQVIQLP